MNYLKRKWQRGLSLVELLITIGVGALIIAGVVGVGIVAIERVQAQQVKRTVTSFLADYLQWQNRRLSRSCDGDATNDVVNLNIGAAITASDAAGAGVYATARGSITAANWNNQRRCRVMWGSLMDIVGSAPETSAVAGTLLAGYDDDGAWEFFVGTPDAGYDLGLATADTATNIVADFADIDGSGGSSPTTVGAPCTVDDNPSSGIILAVPSESVCDLVLADITAIRGVLGASCTNMASLPDNFSGDGALAICT